MSELGENFVKAMNRFRIAPQIVSPLVTVDIRLHLSEIPEPDSPLL